MFVDKVKVRFTAGKGGNGVIAWRREKFIPKGGPSGGNGGRGGSIILRADVQTSSLDWFHRRSLVNAETGGQGGSNRCQGRNGKDLIIKVPCGTLVKDLETGEILCDFTEENQEFLLCQGGRGGRGNDSFKSPTNQAPATCTPGKVGERRTVELELKLIADAGLVGFPNAGKSSLIHALTHVRVKIAPYPFTTLTPNLGYITYPDQARLLLADIPGLIQGASRNRGLGFEFLRHIERTKLLVYVLDASGIDGRNPADDFTVLRHELAAYNPEVLLKPFVVVLNKIDSPEAASHIEAFCQRYPLAKNQLFQTSALEGRGIIPLLEALHAFAPLHKHS